MTPHETQLATVKASAKILSVFMHGKDFDTLTNYGLGQLIVKIDNLVTTYLT